MRDAGPSERRFDIISGYQYWLRDLAPARVIPFRGPKFTLQTLKTVYHGKQRIKRITSKATERA